QELVPSCNKTDKAAMLDKILDYVKFLRLHVKVLSMNRLGEAEREVAKPMEENVGAAMQFLQSKVICIMPISLASLIYPTQQPDTSSLVKLEPSAPS
nr:hypothetical protein [Tanacetum cinerariifolium]